MKKNTIKFLYIIALYFLCNNIQAQEKKLDINRWGERAEYQAKDMKQRYGLDSLQYFKLKSIYFKTLEKIETLRKEESNEVEKLYTEEQLKKVQQENEKFFKYDKESKERMLKEEAEKKQKTKQDTLQNKPINSQINAQPLNNKMSKN